MRTYRVPIAKTTIENGYVDIEAEDEFKAVDVAMQFDRWTLDEIGRFEGSCGDEWNIDVLYEYEAEDVTPPSVSDLLW